MRPNVLGGEYNSMVARLVFGNVCMSAINCAYNKEKLKSKTNKTMLWRKLKEFIQSYSQIDDNESEAETL